MNDTPDAPSNIGERLLNDPTLLTSIADPSDADSLRVVMRSCWEACERDATAERWMAFGNVLKELAVLDETDLVIEFGAPWASEREVGVIPEWAVVRALAPHLHRRGRLVDPLGVLMEEAPVDSPVDEKAVVHEERGLHRDPWMMERIGRALDAVRYADREGLEAELDLLAFAEHVLARYGTRDA